MKQSSLWLSRKFSPHQYTFIIIGLLLFAGGIVLFAANQESLPANPANPYNIQVGVMDSSGWGPQVAAYIKSAGVTWDRIDGTNTTLVNAALSYGFNVVIITPENPASAENTIDTYKSYGSRVVFEFYNEPWTDCNGAPAIQPGAYAADYQTVYNYIHRSGSGVTQPLLFQTIGDLVVPPSTHTCGTPFPSGSQPIPWLATALQSVPSLQVDAFSMHPYGEANQDQDNTHNYGVDALIYNHQDAVNRGFPNTPWYVTEYGFTLNPSQADGNPSVSNTAYVPSFAEQKTQLINAYQQMMTLPWLRMVMYYQSHDDATGWFGLFTAPTPESQDYVSTASNPELTGSDSSGQPTPITPRPAWNALLTFLPTGSGSGSSPPPPPPPPPPATVQNFAWNASTKTLNWSAYPGADAYDIAIVQNPTTTRDTTYVYPPVTGTSYSPSALSNQTVNYGILPEVKNSDGSYSAVAGATWATELSVTWPATPDTTPPSVPTNLTATANSSTQATLSWTASTDNVGVSGYHIYRDGSSTVLATVTAPTVGYNDTTVAAGSTHTYQVAAFDAAGNQSAKTTAVSVTTPSSTTKVGDLNGDGVVNVLDLSILLSHYGTNYAPADLNHDNIVNIFDLSILLGNYGK